MALPCDPLKYGNPFFQVYYQGPEVPRFVDLKPGTMSMGPTTSNVDVHRRVPPRESRVGKLNRIQCSELACLSSS